MRKINKTTWKDILQGANLLGTGGGGTVTGANKILQNITKPVQIVSMSELRDDQLICTVFGVGGKQNCDPILASQKALGAFQKTLQQKIAAIVPVEAGPMAIANAMWVASELRLPVLDSDIVGLRSSPEIFLETISIPNLARTPCIISDGKIIYTITKSLSLKQIEKTFRNFAVTAGGDAIVAGYPLFVRDIKNIFPKNSISVAERDGKLLEAVKMNMISLSLFCKQTGWQIIEKGQLLATRRYVTKGFAQGNYEILSGKNVFKVFFKNENLVVVKNNKTIVTCPDSISLVNINTWEALNNFDENKNVQVVILAKKAIPLWRTKKGKRLFSPKNLGLPYEQVLLG